MLGNENSELTKIDDNVERVLNSARQIESDIHTIKKIAVFFTILFCIGIVIGAIVFLASI